jgi:dTDP-4-amino-4,6-dideoxygalactose transaminase
VQLTRLDGLLDRMRANQRRLASTVEALPGLTLRRPNDDVGDAGICLVAFAATAALAAETVQALQAEGVTAMRIYDPSVPDLHIYPYWAPVLAHLEDEGRSAPDCPRTLDLLERTIHVDLSPLLEDADVDETALAFEKVARGILS